MAKPIDADRLKAVLQNIKEHLEESGEPQSVGMAAVFVHVIEIVDMQPTIKPLPNYCSNCGAKMRIDENA